MKILGILNSLLLLSTLILGCAKGFQTLGVSGEVATDADKVTNEPLTAFVESGPFEGQQVLNNIVNSRLQIIVPLKTNGFLTAGSFSGGEGQITGQVITNSDNHKFVEFSVPASWILHGVNFATTNVLPTGDSLNMFPNNVASHTSIALNNQGTAALHLYFNPPNFGAFVQTPFEQSALRSYPVTYGSTYLDIGRFYTYPHVSSANGGVLLFISLPE